MLGSSEIYSALNVPAITGLLDARSTADTKPALIGDMVIPATWTAKKTANFYLTSPVKFSAEITDYIYTINCRAPTIAKSQGIAYAVAKTLDRQSTLTAFFKCTVKATIPPLDPTDNYNTQVEITIYPRNIEK